MTKSKDEASMSELIQQQYNSYDEDSNDEEDDDTKNLVLL